MTVELCWKADSSACNCGYFSYNAKVLIINQCGTRGRSIQIHDEVIVRKRMIKMRYCVWTRMMHGQVEIHTIDMCIGKSSSLHPIVKNSRKYLIILTAYSATEHGIS